MAELTFRYSTLPKVWPGKKRPSYYKRPAGPFKITAWRPIEQLLLRELAKLGAKDVVIALDMPQPHAWNTQGKPRADARAASPAVIVSFTRRDGAQMMFPCDTFGDWQTNVYAIATALEKLRAIDRYEVMPHGRDQYTGAQLQLPSGDPSAMTPEAAALAIAELAGLPAASILEYPEVASIAVRTAKKRTHPDTDGGSDAAFQRVGLAVQALERLHGATL